MLPIVLVLLVATSALAAPYVSVHQYGINEIAPVPDSGSLVSSFLTDRAFELVDGADTNIYILTIQQILNDLANQPDPQTQAIALGQTIAVLGELGHGIAGDACASADAINAFAVGGNTSGYLNSLAGAIDTVAQLATNPAALRYSTGPRGNCAGGGRSSQFEGAWDRILDHATPYNIGLVNEEYCAAKRLYTAANARSNNVAAAVTAATTVGRHLTNARAPLANFLRAAINGGNVSQAAAAAKAALLG